MDYRHRVILVTGASSGIGRQVAIDAARRGATPVIVARRADRLAEVGDACRAAGTAAVVVPGDIAAPGFAEDLVRTTLATCGRLDILVNNAGISKHKQIYAVTPDDVESTIRVNLIAPIRLALAALPAMLARDEGWIVNVSSVAGKLAPPREAIYAASKFGLTGLTEGLWLDLAGSNVHPIVVHVGPIDTEIWDKTDEPTAFRGKKLPASRVSDAIFDAIARRRHEVWVPGGMRLAWWFRLLAPRLYRVGSARFDPVPPDVIAAARARSRS